MSRPLTSDFTTKPQSSEQHSVGTKTDSQINRTEQSPEITPHTYSQSTYSTGGKETNGGKSHWIATCKELEHFLTPHTKINLKSIKDLNVRPKTTKLLEENIGSGSDGRELACNTGDLGLIPGLGGSPGEGNGTLFQYSCWRIPCTEEPSRGFCTRGRRVGHNWVTASRVAQMVKKSTCNAGDPGSIPGSGRSPGEGNGNPLQYSGLENPMDRGAWWATVHGVTKSQTRLNY